MVKEVNPVQLLKDYVEAFETQRLAAGSLGISAPYLSDLLKGNRTLTPKILEQIGCRMTYVKDLTFARETK